MASSQAFMGHGLWPGFRCREWTGACTLLWSVFSASCLSFVTVAKLTCLLWCLQLVLLAFPYAKCENVSAGCHRVATSGRELFCWLSWFPVHWPGRRFLRVGFFFLIVWVINKSLDNKFYNCLFYLLVYLWWTQHFMEVAGITCFVSTCDIFCLCTCLLHSPLWNHQ